MEGFLDGWNGLNRGTEWESNESPLEYNIRIGQGWEMKLMHQIGIRLGIVPNRQLGSLGSRAQ